MDPALDHSQRGNAILELETDAGRRVLKVYRRRRGLARETLSRASHWLFEGKRSPSAWGRWETERRSVELWGRHGFDAPELYDDPAPPELAGLPCTWFELVPGRPLFWHLVDEVVSEAEKRRLVRALAQSTRRRHALALELRDPLLLHEHPTTKHVLLSGERLVTIDLEGGYRADFSPEVAAGLEVAGLVRSLWLDPARAPFDEPLPRAFLEGYGDLTLLRELAQAAEGGLRGALHRWSDRRRRARPKSAVLSAIAAQTCHSPTRPDAAACAGPAAGYRATC